MKTEWEAFFGRKVPLIYQSTSTNYKTSQQSSYLVWDLDSETSGAELDQKDEPWTEPQLVLLTFNFTIWNMQKICRFFFSKHFNHIPLNSGKYAVNFKKYDFHFLANL